MPLLLYAEQKSLESGGLGQILIFSKATYVSSLAQGQLMRVNIKEAGPDIAGSPDSRVSTPAQFVQDLVSAIAQAVFEVDGMIATPAVAAQRFGINITTMCRPIY